MTSNPNQSAQPCGCDEGAAYISPECKRHYLRNGRLRDLIVDAGSVPTPFQVAFEAAQLAAAADMGLELPAPTVFTVKDSGVRADFGTGMVRDTDAGKVDYERVFTLQPLFERLAAHLTKGAQKYQDNEAGEPNWTHAKTQAELIRFRKSAVRHFKQWLNGEVDEDHAAAVVFNMNGAEHVKARLKEGQ